METWAKLTTMISCVDIIMCSTNAEILLVCVLVLALLGNHERLHIKPVEPRQQQSETHLGHPCKRTNWYLLWRKRAWHSSIGSPTTRFCQHHVPIEVEKSYHHWHYCYNYRMQLWKLLGAGMNASCTFATLDSKRVISFRYRTRHVNGPTSNHRSIMLTIMCQQAAHTS